MRSRRSIAALLALYTVVVASGAPLPLAWVSMVTRPPVAEDERFPCESCPCGCGTAEHCWSACCCHTMRERLEWARREGVRPPESALDEAQRTGLDICQWRGGVRYAVKLPAGDSADDAHLPPCCRAAKRKATTTCCAAKPQAAPKRERSAPGVAILKAMACKGIADAMLLFGEAPILGGPQLVTCEATKYVADAPAPLWRSWTPEPDSPPPRWLV